MSVKGPDGPEDEKPRDRVAEINKLACQTITLADEIIDEEPKCSVEAHGDLIERVDDLRDTVEESRDCLLKVKAFFINAELTVPREVYHCIDRCDLVLRATENATNG